jgi:hypothetical protein
MVMKRSLAAQGLLLLLSGCVSSNGPPPAAVPPPPVMSTRNDPVTLTDANRTAIEAGVRAALGNPANATFRTMIGTKGSDGVVTVCGYVNTGNGDKPYIGTLSDAGFTMTGKGGTADETIATQTACGHKGVHI